MSGRNGSQSAHLQLVMAKHQKKKKRKKEFGGSQKCQKSSDDYQKSMEMLSRYQTEAQ